MARHWRETENRDEGGEQRGGWRGEGGGWQGRGDEEYERWGRGQGGGPGGEPGYYGREGDDVRHGGQPGREWGGREWAGDYGGGSQAASGWRANQSAFYGEEGGNTGRDMPYSHGGYGHRQRRGMGGSGQSGSGAGGYGYERDWQRDQPEYDQSRYEQRGARWGQFGSAGRGGPARGDPGEETWGPRAQRSLGTWREQYGSGEEYGRGGGPAGQMDYSHGDYGRDLRGPHRGKGPKGYERSAERLKEDICERLSDAHDVDASEISIACKDGIVTLEGSVESRQMRHRAEDIVESCSGVKDVENRLKVQSRQGQAAGQSDGQSGTSNQNRLSTGGPLHH